jgi:hypothetical protein
MDAGLIECLVDVKGRYYHGLVRLAGGLSELSFLKNEAILNLLMNAQLRKGSAYTYRQLLAIGKPQAQVNDFMQHLQMMVSKHMLLRGYSVQCPFCRLELWYPQVPTMCEGCHTALTMPLEQDFAYRLNPLLAMVAAQGGLTVLLTALYFYQRHPGMQWDASIMVDGVEIDFIARVAGELLIAECKDDFPPEHDLQPLKALAAAHNIQRVITATLSEDADCTLTRRDLLA